MKKILYILLFLLFFQSIENKIHLLLQEDEILKICSKCESTFNFTYNNSELLDKTSLNDKITPYVIQFVEILKSDNNSKGEITDYIYPRVVFPNLIYIILLLLLIIIWIILIILVSKNKKCLKFKTSFNNTISKKHYLYYISFIIIIILSSISFYFIYESSTYLNTSICALFRIYIDLRDGDQANTTYWKGIKNLQKDLVGDKSIINQLLYNIELQENITNDLKNNDPNKKYYDNTFYKEEQNNNFYYNYQVSSPSSSILKVYPSYTRNRKNDLNDIQIEYTTKLYQGVKVNEDISLINKPIKENPSLIISEFALVNNYLNDILDTVQVSVEVYLQYLVDYSKILNTYVYPTLYSVFSLIILFSIFGIISIYKYINNNKKKYFIILQIIWNIKLFLLLFAIISQILFKFFVIFGEDGSGILQYATSEDNLDSSDSIIFKGAGKAFLKMCFNGNNGDLLSKILEFIDYDSSKLAQLKSILLAEIFVKEYYKQMEETQLDKTKGLCDNLENMYKDYSLISYYELLNSKTCQDDLDDLNLYTDYSNILTHQSPLSNKHSFDVWTTLKKNCNNYNNYEYINSESSRIEGNKYCMVLDDFDKNTAKNFYTSISCVLSKDVDEHFSDYYDGLNNFNKENKVYLNENPNFIQMTNKYYNELLLIKEIILNGLTYSKNIIDLINILLKSSSDADVPVDLFSFMNCHFLQRDLKVFYIEMERLCNNSIPFIIINIFTLIGLLTNTILIIIIIYKYSKKGKELNSERESSNNINLLN